MRRSLGLLPLLLAACTYIPPQERATYAPASTRAYPTGASAAEPLRSRTLREPYTTYLSVTDATGQAVGYLLRYDPIPAHIDETIEREGLTGSMFVEDRDFHRIGFITQYGRAYSFRGTNADELGQAPLLELLPLFYGEGTYRAEPLR